MKLEISGDLTKEEVEEILKLIRKIEQRDPVNKLVMVWLEMPDMSLEETVKLIKKFFPDKAVAR